jgi:hypothetical protein
MHNLRSLKYTAIVAAAGVAAFAITAYARLIAVDPKEVPDPALPEAYAKAVEALRPETKKFHCVGADSLGISDTAGPTEWHFYFYAQDGAYREVIVSTKDKVIIRDHQRDVY